MGPRGQLDRIPVAHTGPILSLDWYTPQSGIDGLPSVSSEMWVATGGLDRCVKVIRFTPSLRVVIHCLYARCGISTPAQVAMALNHPYTISTLPFPSVVSFGGLGMVVNSRLSRTSTLDLARGRMFPLSSSDSRKTDTRRTTTVFNPVRAPEQPEPEVAV
jgi:hypothetical protein